MPHFFINTSEISSDKIKVSEKSVFHHLVKVLRVKIGEELSLVDENQTQYKTEIVEINSNYLTVKIIEQNKSKHYLQTQIYLAQAVLKSDAQNLIVQKATELGVKGIIPLSTDNTVLKSSVIDAKIDKWSKIALEAVKQCERTDIPKVFERKTLKEILNDEEFNIKIACVERSERSSFKNYLRGLKLKKEYKILVIIGPEGGFSQSEIKLIDKSNVQKVSLGKLILRAETAVITALSNMIYELEDE